VHEEKKDDKVEEVTPQEQELLQDFHDTTLLPFPRRNRRAKIDKQFGKFVEVIQKLYINIPLLDAIQVPTYAKYLQDILNNKRPLPSTEMIKLIEECSAAILNMSLVKKKDPGAPLLIAQSEVRTLRMLYAILEQVSVSCPRRSSTSSATLHSHQHRRVYN
jgi:hypothetical protein